jgi:hypothetical protein
MKTPEDYIKEVKEASDKEWNENGYVLAPPTFSINRGAKYVKVIICTFGQKSVHCFLDNEGNIYKAASWNKPAKGIRGNINNDKKPLLGREFYRR